MILAIGEEHDYWLRVAEFTALGVTTPNFALTVFALGHKDIDGLVGMNFLRHFNFEVRPADQQILVELVNDEQCQRRGPQLRGRGPLRDDHRLDLDV
ncbi:MAG TPA: hypothetical protein VLM79_14695 [Kofleriaceae bacterium]|nr:hypothetical protein [Kofleriaceae bacterium]